MWSGHTYSRGVDDVNLQAVRSSLRHYQHTMHDIIEVAELDRMNEPDAAIKDACGPWRDRPWRWRGKACTLHRSSFR